MSVDDDGEGVFEEELVDIFCLFYCVLIVWDWYSGGIGFGLVIIENVIC